MGKYNKYLKQLVEIDYTDLNIEVCRELLSKYEIDLKFLTNERRMWFEKTQPASNNYSNEVVNGGKGTNKYILYCSKVEELEPIIDLYIDRINNLSKWKEETMKTLGTYEIERNKVIDRRKSGMSWNKIEVLSPFCRRSCFYIWSEYKKSKEKVR